MSCQKVTRLQSDRLERQLSLKERIALKVHVMMCSACNNFGVQMGLLRNIAHSYAKGYGEKTFETNNLRKSNNESKK